MRKNTNLVIISCVVAMAFGVASATDYCATTCGGTQNIGCNNNENWDSACPSDKTLLDLTTADKNLIVALHNEHRDYIAGGNDPELNAACRMATMRWNDELAYLASLNVRSCAMRHDACHNTDAFKFAGQNLAWVGFFPPLNATSSIITSVDMWYNEVSNTKQAYIDAYPSGYSGPTIGHFTVMVADRNTDVGCAVSTYSVSGQSYKAFLMACNYATTNILGVKMYKSCSSSAQECTTGRNSQYSNLCSANEQYDPNNLSY
ncbi:venom allergen 5-like [Scaptodrosophila lebanonensis]|uniref:Venom allergen-1 n=1 Tax=Drosophila lebanonensis TaxID=7225 RepID=A0A6J2UHA0_DROLE|nr:venom allergen 5-like [Scaptodrosophila lebanonensis]